MTREELKEHCERQIKQCETWAKTMGEEPKGKIHEEHKLILELLEREPCEDCISRRVVIDTVERWLEYSGYNEAERHIMMAVRSVLYDLPPVTPQPKIGHWIFDDECKEHGHCSHCGYGSVDLVDGEPHNFCRNCGARMVEPQEKSEGKE